MNFYEKKNNLLQKIEQTRVERRQVTKISLSFDERRELLEKYHPDYVASAQRPLALGPNKGDKIAHELADLLEAYACFAPSQIDLNKIDFDVDVLVIGGGGAGLAAALEAKKAGAKVLLVTKLRLGDSNTVMAQGGIQAADRPADSPLIHYLDVLGGGHFTNDPDLVEALALDAPGVIAWLEELGFMFDKEPDGKLKEIHGGGTSKRRLHSAKDYTGLEIARVIRDEFFNQKINYREFCAAIELIKDEKGQVAGAVLLNMETQNINICRAKTIILATGGMGRLHVQGFPCSNHYGATADGIVIAYRAGVPFVFLNAIQYHPTGVVFPEEIIGLLVTEKVRGLGGQLLNSDGESFIDELLPRDIVASAIIREVKERGKGIKTDFDTEGVWLDTPMIDLVNGAGTTQKELAAMYIQYKKFGIEIDKQPILVYPTQHYQNGGLKIDTQGQTPVKNLFAAGEVSGGIHGENRLMGNSLLDILVFGRRAGQAAAEVAKKTKLSDLTLKHVSDYNKLVAELKIDKKRQAPLLLPTYASKGRIVEVET